MTTPRIDSINRTIAGEGWLTTRSIIDYFDTICDSLLYPRLLSLIGAAHIKREKSTCLR
jgi:hypothetical protein